MSVLSTYLYNLSVPRAIVVQITKICLSHLCRNNAFKKALSFYLPSLWTLKDYSTDYSTTTTKTTATTVYHHYVLK